MAGLPETAQAVVMSVAEVWLPPPPQGMSIGAYSEELRSHPQPFQGWEEGGEALGNAEAMVRKAALRLHSLFPGWDVSSEATYGSPAWELIAKADAMRADVIVVGSHGRSALGRFFLGSVSQKVLTEAECSVRVSRGKIEVDETAPRILIGFDGSHGAEAAVEVVAARRWPDNTEIKLASVTDISFGAEASVMTATSMPDNSEWLNELAERPMSVLSKAGLKPEFVSDLGNPKVALVEIAENWHADSIFVGANRWGSRVERFLLGSVSAAVAARAHCSVEVVRKKV
jgi:nucleotide-binding universal stress UspA family protein